MFLLNMKELWDDYKYWFIVAIILLVALIAIIISSLVSYLKSKRKDLTNVSEENNEANISESQLENNESLEETDDENQAGLVRNEDEMEIETSSETKNDLESDLGPHELEEENNVEDSLVEPSNQIEDDELTANESEENEIKEQNSLMETDANLLSDDPVEEIGELETQVKARGKYEILPDRDGFKYVLKASNGQPLIDSEVYTSITGCKNAIKRLKENVKTSEIRIEQDKKGNYQFLIIRGSRVTAHSANYRSKVSAQNAANSFLKFVESDKIEIIEESSKVQPELVNLSNEEFNVEKTGKIVIFKEDDLYLFKLVANNGQTICVSTSYKTLTALKNNIQKFKDVVYTGRFYITQDKYHNYQFKLYGADSNRLILTGETFQTRESCLSNIKSCYRFTKNAIIEDMTI